MVAALIQRTGNYPFLVMSWGETLLKSIKMVHSLACWCAKKTTHLVQIYYGRWRQRQQQPPGEFYLVWSIRPLVWRDFSASALPLLLPSAPSSHFSHMVQNLWKFLVLLSVARIPPAATKTSSIFLHLDQTVLWYLKKIRIDKLRQTWKKTTPSYCMAVKPLTDNRKDVLVKDILCLRIIWK